MIALFLIIVAAIMFAPIIKAVGKAGIFLLLIFIGVGWIGYQFSGTTTAQTVTTPIIQTASSPAPEQIEEGSADKTSAQPDPAAAEPSPIQKAIPVESVSHAEPGSATEWNEEDKKPDKKHGKSTRRATAEVEAEPASIDEELFDDYYQRGYDIGRSHMSPKAKVRALNNLLEEIADEADEETADPDQD